ncbi:MAG: Glycine/D-amino acid oxidases (deaminating), partial [uncultured Rubellimicrobium sp.]
LGGPDVARPRHPHPGLRTPQGHLHLGRPLRLQRARPERGAGPLAGGAELPLRQRLLRPRLPAGSRRGPRPRGMDHPGRLAVARPVAPRLRPHRPRRAPARTRHHL